VRREDAAHKSRRRANSDLFTPPTVGFGQTSFGATKAVSQISHSLALEVNAKMMRLSENYERD
jgi:hypothetical protein